MGQGVKGFPHRIVPVLGAVRQAGYRIVFCEEAFDGIAEPTKPVRFDPPLLAAIAWCSEMYPATQTAGLRRFLEIARKYTDVPLVAGGRLFSSFDARTLDLEGLADVVVVGPGEVVLPRLLHALLERSALSNVPGLVIPDRAGSDITERARRRPLEPELNRPLQTLELERYVGPAELVFDNREPAIQIQTGAGCAKRCPFCFDERTQYGVFPAGAVVDAIRTVHERTRVRQFMFGELDFFHDLQRVVDVARGLARIRFPGRWFALASICDVQRMSDDDLEVVSARCHRLELGTESGSDRMLARLGKRHRAHDAVHAVARLAARGVRTTHNLMFGLPDETNSDRRATVALIRRIRKQQPAAAFNFRQYQLVPNSTLGESLDEFPGRIRLSEVASYRHAAGQMRALPWLDQQSERTVCKLIRYLLPMAYEQSGPLARPGLTRILRMLARIRCRLGIWRGTGLEENVLARLGSQRFETFVP